MGVTPMIIQAKVYGDTNNLYAYVREGTLVEGQVFDFRGKQYKVQCIFGADESFGRNLVGFMASPEDK